MSQEKIKILQRALIREKSARKQAEKILEDKSRYLYYLSQELKTANVTLEGLLDEKSTQLEGVFENILDAYVVMDLTGNVIKFNEAAILLFGYDIAIESVNVVDLIYKEDQEYAMSSFSDLQSKGFFKNYEARIYTKSKEVRWVHINASVIYDKNKNPIAAQGIVRDITDQRQLENSLEAQRQKYSNIIANMNLGLMEVDNDDKIIFVNKSFSDMSGYSKEELIGRTAGDVFLTEEDKKIISRENKKRTKGQSNSFELKLTNKKGETKYWLISGGPNYNLKGEVIGSIGIHLDITEVKRSEKLIEEQKKELNVIVDNSSLGIILSQSGIIKKTNNAIQQELGYTEEELYNLNLQEIYFNDTSSELEHYLLRMHSGRIDSFVISQKLKKKNGSILWAKTSVNAVRDNSGDIKYQVALIENKSSERENTLIIETINDLAKSILGKLNIYEIALEITNDIAEYLNSEDCVIYLVDNEKKLLEQIAAYGEKLDSNNEIINKISLPIGKGIVGTVAKTGKPELIKNTALDDRYIQDGPERLSEIVVPIISEGIVIGVIDSEHPKQNFFNKEHLNTLERIANLVAMQLKSAINLRERVRVENKNQELLNQLSKSNDELHQYAHIISHDLKSPLLSIDALVNWLKEDNKDKLDEASLQNMALIETTLEKMEQLISDVLNYSSVSSDNSKMFDVNTDVLVKELINILYIPKHIELKVCKTLPIVRGDKTKLQQVFQNLISNAVKFSKEDTGLIEIDVTSTAEFYQFSIKDNGIGIEKKYHKKIFEIFHSLTKSKDSSGIGLSIVKKIVALHEGDIWLESEPGKGTTFYFTLKK